MEAEVAMDNAQVDGTWELQLSGTNKNMAAAHRTYVDLSEASLCHPNIFKTG